MNSEQLVDLVLSKSVDQILAILADAGMGDSLVATLVVVDVDTYKGNLGDLTFSVRSAKDPDDESLATVLQSVEDVVAYIRANNPAVEDTNG